MAISEFVFANFYTTTLAASLSSTATTLSVSSTTGLPTLSTGQAFPLVLTSAASPGSVYEVVYCTGISGSSLTIERGQEGTTAANWNAADIIFTTMTANTVLSNTGSTLTGGTLAGTTTNSGTISGGTVSGATLSGTTTNSGTISGGTIANPTMTGTIAVPNAGGAGQALSSSQAPSNLSTLNNETSNRAVNTTYTNNTGKPMFVMISCSMSGGYINGVVDGNSIIENGNSNGTVTCINTLSFFVPSGNTYELSSVDTLTISYWYEFY
jgi:hypothetical protein